jgi:HNH endonuclease
MSQRITQDQCVKAFLYEPNSGKLIWQARSHAPPAVNARWTGKEAGTIMVTEDGKSYRKVCVDRVQVLAHRIIWTMLHGSIPRGMEIDHQDGDGTNNRLENLRLVTPGENMKNVRLGINNSSGFKGVRRTPTKTEKWQAFCHMGGKFFHLGCHDTREAAFEARKQFHANHGKERAL